MTSSIELLTWVRFTLLLSMCLGIKIPTQDRGFDQAVVVTIWLKIAKIIDDKKTIPDQ